jgi:hypothetical protein
MRGVGRMMVSGFWRSRTTGLLEKQDNGNDGVQLLEKQDNATGV